jgi:hypothetical protein
MLVKPKFRPGIVKTDTALQNEGGYSDGNRVRFYQGQPQPIGGWQLLSPSQFDGRARGSHSWTNLQGQQCIAFGTNEKLYAVIGGSIRDITPYLHFTVLTDALSTVSGSPTVTVTMPYHNLSAGDVWVASNHQSTVGGLTIDGSYPITTVISDNEFQITHGSNASSTVTGGGGNIDVTVVLPVGLEDNALGGYGTGTYGSGLYGSAGFTTDLRVWSLDNFGENLLANPSGYGLFEYQPETTYEGLASNGTFTGNADGWGLGTGWAYSSNNVAKSAGTASNLSQSVVGLNLDGRTCVVTFTVTRSAGTLKFRVNAGDPPAIIDVSTASAAITKSGTYTRIFRMPADASDIIFEADSSFIGTVDSVSYKLYDKAYPITTAPARMDAMFVDPRGVVVAVGCIQVDGIYNPTCVRNSAVSNNRLWIPDTDNVASELILRGGGGRLMAGCATRQQSMVWGDDGVFSLQWLGDAGAAFTPQLLATSCGLLSRHSFAKTNGFVMFVTNTRDFFIFRGIGATSLGVPEKVVCPLREDIFDNLDFDQSLKAFGGLNPAWTEFWFWWPDTRDVTAPAPAECSRYVAFNWVDGTWHCGSLARTSWIPSGVLTDPVAFEPRASSKGLIYFHETGTTANGGLLGAWLQTSDLDIEDGDKLGTVTAIVPDFAQQSGNIDFTVYSRPFANGTTITKGPYTATPTTQRLPVRVLGRQLSMRLDWTTTGGFGRLGALRVDLNPTGAKR